MKTFTNILQKEETPVKNNNIVYKSTSEKGINVIVENEYEYVSEPDIVMCLIYLVDRRELLLRKEIVPAYQSRNKENAFFITCVSGQIENGESHNNAIVRELYEETGIRINPSYSEAEYWGEYFMTKGNSMKTHVYYFPLFKDDYISEIPKGDGSNIENNSTTLRISVDELDKLRPVDISSALLIEKFKVREKY